MFKKKIMAMFILAVVLVASIAPCAFAAEGPVGDAAIVSGPVDNTTQQISEETNTPVIPINEDTGLDNNPALYNPVDNAGTTAVNDEPAPIDNTTEDTTDDQATTDDQTQADDAVEEENPNAARNRYLLVGGICLAICVGLYIAVRIKANKK